MTSFSSVCTIHVFLFYFTNVRLHPGSWLNGNTAGSTAANFHISFMVILKKMTTNLEDLTPLFILLYLLLLLSVEQWSVCVCAGAGGRWLLAFMYFLVQCFYCWNKDVPFERMDVLLFLLIPLFWFGFYSIHHFSFYIFCCKWGGHAGITQSFSRCKWKTAINGIRNQSFSDGQTDRLSIDCIYLHLPSLNLH